MKHTVRTSNAKQVNYVHNRMVVKFFKETLPPLPQCCIRYFGNRPLQVPQQLRSHSEQLIRRG